MRLGRGTDEGNQRLVVAGDGEVVHRKIALNLIMAVPRGGIVVGPDRHAVVIEEQAIGGEKLVEDVIAGIVPRRDRAFQPSSLKQPPKPLKSGVRTGPSATSGAAPAVAVMGVKACASVD